MKGGEGAAGAEVGEIVVESLEGQLVSGAVTQFVSPWPLLSGPWSCSVHGGRRASGSSGLRLGRKHRKQWVDLSADG